MRLTDAVLKEVVSTKMFTVLDFWGTHDGKLEINDTNEACILDEATLANDQPDGTRLHRRECSHF